MNESIVISLGGSVISGDPIDADYLQSFAKILASSKFKRIGIVTGGGKTARSYISLLRSLGINENMLDEIGIYATRMNALSLASLLKGANPIIPSTVEEAVNLMSEYRFVVMGGTEPGHTTDTVAALLCERSDTDTLINITSVDGVYDLDPNKYKDARRFDTLGYREAITLSTGSSVGAGPNVFMDITALSIAMRSKIKVIVASRDLNNLKNILEGKPSVFTSIEEKA
ncbi:uridylate kinase [Thermoplasma volcanium GSS1]|uniref:Uridylate kinase n=1 Tax=Thermoplasma volcanium (strain ATCC 51530 / DSM 4299 / JCM 9571 / NBRC 15438 / GSS1) TaxID=273116 RepID=PYRH_THEVO|nr:UMP kinase [Thermoplasma volcanium]Q97B72.1 RecName: Full=Uridylate kinase; Short=UK; AltName: Full=Uridine monophosphate kinase; Short=UMP kinase; Short=UMPK [Thermoplasma volcanium GSS1]BAB59727.1 uridylate kinase [Thermoplasma volcanium GSS1]